MPRAAKVLLWAFVFVGAAGVGAYIAAHSNPFPPSVDGGSSSSPSVPVVTLTSAGPTPEPSIWKGTLRSTSYHQLHVGGRCSTTWRGSMTLAIDDAGDVQGAATVRRVGALRCDFPIAQAQIAKLTLDVTGSVSPEGLELHLQEASRTPSSGADDYGGFVRTVLVPGARSALLAEESHGDAEGALAIRRIDQEGRGTYVSKTRVRLGCARRCPE